MLLLLTGIAVPIVIHVPGMQRGGQVRRSLGEVVGDTTLRAGIGGGQVEIHRLLVFIQGLRSGHGRLIPGRGWREEFGRVERGGHGGVSVEVGKGVTRVVGREGEMRLIWTGRVQDRIVQAKSIQTKWKRRMGVVIVAVVAVVVVLTVTIVGVVKAKCRRRRIQGIIGDAGREIGIVGQHAIRNGRHQWRGLGRSLASGNLETGQELTVIDAGFPHPTLDVAKLIVPALLLGRVGKRGGDGLLGVRMAAVLDRDGTRFVTGR